MFYPPETILALAVTRQQELIAEAERHRVLRAARRRSRHRASGRGDEPVAHRQPAGTLAACGPRAAVPAR